MKMDSEDSCKIDTKGLLQGRILKEQRVLKDGCMNIKERRILKMQMKVTSEVGHRTSKKKSQNANHISTVSERIIGTSAKTK
jgi:hypothetical protein